VSSKNGNDSSVEETSRTGNFPDNENINQNYISFIGKHNDNLI